MSLDDVYGVFDFNMVSNVECKEAKNAQEDSDSYPDNNSYDSDFEINIEHDESVKIAAKKQYNDDKYDKAKNQTTQVVHIPTRTIMIPRMVHSARTNKTMTTKFVLDLMMM